MTRWEKKTENDEAMLYFARGLIVWNKVLLKQDVNLFYLKFQELTMSRKEVLYTPYNGAVLLENPLLNKGLAFIKEERDNFNLHESA